MRTRSPSSTLPTITTLTSMNTSRPTADLAADVEARRIRERDAFEHQRIGALRAQRRFQLSQLHLVVHAQHLRFGRRNDRVHFHAGAHGHHDDVGQIVLALRVVVLQRGEPVAQRAGRRDHQARVDFADRALLGVRVLLLRRCARRCRRCRARCGRSRSGSVEHHCEQAERARSGCVRRVARSVAARTSGTSPNRTSTW